MKERGTHDEIEAALCKRQRKRVGGNFGRIGGDQMNRPAVQRNHRSVAKSLLNALAHVAGTRAHVENRKSIIGSNQPPEEPDQSSMSPEPAVDPRNVSQIPLRLHCVCRVKSFGSDNPAFGAAKTS
jgi:hypothetical protein